MRKVRDLRVERPTLLVNYTTSYGVDCLAHAAASATPTFLRYFVLPHDRSTISHSFVNSNGIAQCRQVQSTKDQPCQFYRQGVKVGVSLTTLLWSFNNNAETHCLKDRQLKEPKSLCRKNACRIWMWQFYGLISGRYLAIAYITIN